MADHHIKYLPTYKYNGNPLTHEIQTGEDWFSKKVNLSKISPERYIYNCNLTHINIHLLVNILIIYVIPLSMGPVIELPFLP